MENRMRKTKIICTLGPAVEQEEMLRELILGGMNCARLNFSHGTQEEQKARMDRVKKVRRELNRPVALLLDTKGPEIRLGLFEHGFEMLEEGQEFTLCADASVSGNKERAGITYPYLAEHLKPGTRVLIDDGNIGMVVLRTEGENVVFRVLNGGKVSNRKSINIPDVEIPMEYISEADQKDILFGIAQEVDFIAASFVRSAQDILDVRKLLVDNGGGKIQIIAKIENMQGINHAEEIIAVSDGVMVARGDMGVEVEFTRLPAIQKQLIRKCYEAGKIVITATQMLESMMHNPRPTRAEISDVANAVYDGTTATMLSGESAAGAYPVEAVTTMARIAEETEKSIDYVKRFHERQVNLGDNISCIIAEAACAAAHRCNAAAIVVLTRNGYTAELISGFHPKCPIFAGVIDEQGARQLTLAFGVQPFYAQEQESAESLFDYAVEIARKSGMVSAGDTIVIVAGDNLKQGKPNNMLKLYRMEESSSC